MPIAIGGELHEDEVSYAAKQAGISIKPVEEDKPSTPSGTSLGSPEKPAGTLDAEGMIHPTPDYMNPPESSLSFRPSATGIITKTLKDAWEAFKAPGEAKEGKLPMWAVNPETGEVNTSMQAIEKAHNLASLMVTGPAPVASKMADGTLGSFMGVRSKTVNKEELYRAQNMEMGMTHPDEIYRETGTFRGADGRWRQEISDAESSLKKDNLDYKPATPDFDVPGSPKGWGGFGNEESIGIKSHRYELPKDVKDIDWAKYEKSILPPKPTLMKDILDHPELLKAYPEVGNIKVKNLHDYDPYGVSGLDLKNVGGIHQGDTIYMANAHPDTFHSVLLHEIQHHIQDIESFARGGNPGQFLPKKLAPAEEFFNKVRSQTETELQNVHGIPIKTQDLVKRIIKSVEDGISSPEAEKQLRAFSSKFPEGYEKLRNIAKSEQLLDSAKLVAHEDYRRLMGEVEARNVQNRMHQSWVEQLNNPPRKTEDVPRFMQKHSDDVQGHSAVSASQEVKSANDNDLLGRKDFKSYNQAVNNQKVIRELKLAEDTHVGDYNHWKDIAVKENRHTIVSDRPNAMTAAREHSENGKTTVLIRHDGRRLVYKDGVQVARDSYR